MGSFRLFIYIPYLHDNYNFIKLVVKTVKELLHYSLRLKLPNKLFSYLKTVRRLPLATYLTDYFKFKIEFSS